MGISARALHGAKICLIPMPDNDDRPLALRHKPLAFISALLLVAKVLATGVIFLTPASAELSTITAARIVQLTNAERKKSGLKELTVNSKLASAAVQKGNHMLEEDYFAHISPTGVTPWFWMSKVGYLYTTAGENLAIDFLEAEDVVQAWLNSPSHKENMLKSDYTETGVGVVSGEFEGGTSIIVVHMFGRPPVVAATPTPAPNTIPSPAPTVKSQTTVATPSPTPRATTPPLVTPAPLPEPSFVPTPPAPPGDTTPPRIPRIAQAPTAVGATVALEVTGEPETIVHFLINNQDLATVRLNQEGVATHTVSFNQLPDGTITLRVFAVDAAGNRSDASEPLALTKDTQGPVLARQQVSFLVSPATETAMAALTLRDVASAEATITQKEQNMSLLPGKTSLISIRSPFTLAAKDSAGNQSELSDITLSPDFAFDPKLSYLAPPSRFTQLARRLTAGIFVVLLILLVLSILIRVRIQRPALIAHASLVLVLAAAFFIWS